MWAVCRLFPQQRWRTLTYSVSGNHWSGEPRDTLKTTSARKFSSCVWSHLFSINTSSSNTLCLLPDFFAAATHSLQCESTGVKSNNMDAPRRHSKYTMTMRLFPVSEKLPVSNHKKKDIWSLVVLDTHTHTYTHTIILLIELVIFSMYQFIIVYKFVFVRRLVLNVPFFRDVSYLLLIWLSSFIYYFYPCVYIMPILPFKLNTKNIKLHQHKIVGELKY